MPSLFVSMLPNLLDTLIGGMCMDMDTVPSLERGAWG